MKAKSVASAIDASCLTSTQTSIKASPYIAAPYPSRSQRHPEITNAITFHLAKDMCPINTVSNEGINERVNKAYLTKSMLSTRTIIFHIGITCAVCKTSGTWALRRWLFCSPALNCSESVAFCYGIFIFLILYFIINIKFTSLTNLSRFKHCKICPLLI